MSKNKRRAEIDRIRKKLQTGTAFTRLIASEEVGGSSGTWNSKRKKKSKKNPRPPKAYVGSISISLKTTGFVDYQAYLSSSHWARKRRQAFSFHGSVCNRCSSTAHLVVHHKSYKNLGAELMEDLEILCNTCHDKHHGRTKKNKGHLQ